MKKLDKKLLEIVKKGFVPMPGGAAEPVAGAGLGTAALAGPMATPPGTQAGMMGGDPAMAGMDPAMAAGGGMPPMDPSMAGMDPAMSGGGGMPPMDPAMMEALLGAGMSGGGAAPEGMPGQISFTISVPEFIQIIQVLSGGKATDDPALSPDKKKSGKNEMGEKLDQILSLLGGSAPQPQPQQPM